ncbi:tetratricopeptide repeat protein [Sorangium sp. So ce1099]|uniref:tetratricopeptide repeat protein n=1 Tax=Sorangium sp. So ce1099 TaxID=3133331 RepID=UPI003F60A481
MGLTKQLREPVAWRGVLPIALLCAMCHTASAQPANPKAQAKALFEQGRAASEAGDCTSAIPLFRQSQATFPARGTLYNLALCEAELGRVASASQHFTELLTQLPAGDPRLPIARKHIADLDSRLPKLVIEFKQGEPVPSEVLLDQTPLPQASRGGELPVDPGDHVIVARWDDGRQTEERASLTEAARKVVRLAPPAIVTPTPVGITNVPQTTSRAPGPSSAPAAVTPHVVAFVVGGVGVAALVGSLVAGGLALGAKGDLEKECPQPSRCSVDGLNMRSRGEALSTTGTVLGTIGVVGISAGVVFLFTSPERGFSVALAPATLPGGGGALLRSSF